MLIKDKGLTPNIKVNPRNSKTKEPIAPLPIDYKNLICQ